MTNFLTTKDGNVLIDVKNGDIKLLVGRELSEPVEITLTIDHAEQVVAGIKRAIEDAIRYKVN